MSPNFTILILSLSHPGDLGIKVSLNPLIKVAAVVTRNHTGNWLPWLGGAGWVHQLAVSLQPWHRRLSPSWAQCNLQVLHHCCHIRLNLLHFANLACPPPLPQALELLRGTTMDEKLMQWMRKIVCVFSIAILYEYLTKNDFLSAPILARCQLLLLARKQYPVFGKKFVS